MAIGRKLMAAPTHRHPGIGMATVMVIALTAEQQRDLVAYLGSI